MSGWKTKLFGDNRLNFYGWIAGGLVVIGISLALIVCAMLGGALRSPSGLILLAIYLVLLGQFCLALQNYHARLAEKLDSSDEKANGSK